MEGVGAYNCSTWHGGCESVMPIFNGVGLWLWCCTCRQLCNLEAVSPKLQSWVQDPESKGSVKGLALPAGTSNLDDLARALVKALRESDNASHS